MEPPTGRRASKEWDVRKEGGVKREGDHGSGAAAGLEQVDSSAVREILLRETQKVGD
jgi:hypothetical protein